MVTNGYAVKHDRAGDAAPSPTARWSQPLWDLGSWRDRGACVGMGPELFFPHGERDEEAMRQVAAAKSVCASCAVRLHCLVFALRAHPEEGIWGGMTRTERAALRRARHLRRVSYVRPAADRPASLSESRSAEGISYLSG